MEGQINMIRCVGCKEPFLKDWLNKNGECGWCEHEQDYDCKKRKAYEVGVLNEVCDDLIKTIEKNNKRLDRLASSAHQCWSDWMKHLFSKCTMNKDGSATIPKSEVKRWKRQIKTPFRKLSEEEKNSDRDVVLRYYNDL